MSSISVIVRSVVLVGRVPIVTVLGIVVSVRRSVVVAVRFFVIMTVRFIMPIVLLKMVLFIMVLFIIVFLIIVLFKIGLGVFVIAVFMIATALVFGPAPAPSAVSPYARGQKEEDDGCSRYKFNSYWFHC